MNGRNRTKLAAALVVSGALGACGGGAISPQLRDARTVVSQAEQGPASRFASGDVSEAKRELARAESSGNGSVDEAHFAYLADRDARRAMAEARRMQLTRAAELAQVSYQQTVTRLARDRAMELAMAREAAVDREQALTAEQIARAAAEARAAEMLERLRDLATIRQEQDRTVITLSGEVIFPTNRSELRRNSRARLQAVAEALNAAPDQTATILGFTDSRGSDEYNLALSERRATSVRDFLAQHGVLASRMTIEGRGEADPVDTNDTAEGRANNRRVEIVLRTAPPAAGIRPQP